MIELELKAVVADPGELRRRLLEAGATPGFVGMMHDRRFDRAGELVAGDQVLRIRRYESADGERRTRTSWKGPVSIDRGYKRRPEIEFDVAGDGPVEAVFEALGYRVSDAIDRFVEYFAVAGATVRLEWYPRMDVLIEVEGEPAAIESAVLATGIPRSAFTAESLAAFVARYQARAERPAATALATLGDGAPGWSTR